MLYLAKDTKRINDIVNKYNIPEGIIEQITPELEGYIKDKKDVHFGRLL